MSKIFQTRINLVIISFLFTLQIQAKTNWKTLTEAAYIENLVSCQIKLKKLQWKNTLWPKENNKQKPDFYDVFDENELHKQTLQNLNKQFILRDKFNIKIDESLLQADINRMSKDTKDADALQKIYQVLDNNPENIALCLSRPYLVENLLTKNYYWNDEIHSQLKIKAQNDLDTYLESSIISSSKASINYVTYSLIGEKQKTNDVENNELTIELREDELNNKIEEIKSQYGLKQNQTSFSYTEIINITDKEIKTKSLVWQKQSLNRWIEDQGYQDFPVLLPDFDTELMLTAIENKSLKNTNYSSLSNSWELPNQPNKRFLHTAIWTGSEMIIWGGVVDGKNNTGARYNPASDSWVFINKHNAPEGTLYHTATWTGSEMIVWGGLYNDENNIGSRYNPISDTWNTMSNTNAPAARGSHTSIWTGTQLIVWGGELVNSNAAISTNTGGLYDPDTDSWQATSVNNTLITRKYHSSVWTGSEMIIWGGMSVNQNFTANFLNSGFRYNPEKDSWVEITLINAPSARKHHTTVWTGSEMILWGGYGNNIDPIGHRYNPELDSWRPTRESNAPPRSRSYHSMIWTGTDMIIWGGYNERGELKSGYKYNPIQDRWTAIPYNPAPSKRYDHTAVWTGTEMIVWGGREDSYLGYFDNGGRYNPLTNSWIPMITVSNNAPEARNGHSAVWTGNELLIWGGRLNGNYNTNTGSWYNLATDRWQSISTNEAPSSRYNHRTVWTGTEMLVWGGEGTIDSKATGSLFNIINNSWTPINLDGAPLNSASHSTVWSGEEMIVWGSANNDTLQSGSRYNPNTNTWIPMSDINAPEGRYYHDAVWADNQMIVWGGIVSGGATNTGARYSPSNDSWQAMTTSGAPSPRRASGLTWTGDVVIVWGGYNGGPLNSGAKYNPVTNNWVAMTNDNVPIARNYNSTIWTGDEMIIWGGLTNGNTNTGGSYNPLIDRWISTNIDGSPEARVFHSVTWTESEMIIWGGWTGTHSLDSMGIYYPYVEGIYANSFDLP